MKYIVVICVLIYFELVASYPYGEEYLEANRPPSERRLQFSNFAQPGPNVPPGSYYQNGFKPETTKPYFGNVGAYRASNVPLETGSNLRPVQDQNYPVQGRNYPGQKNLPVQQLPHQPGFSNEFLENQAKLSQFQPQYAAVPHLKIEDESYLNPVVRQYPSVNHVENIENSAAFRPQYDQNLPLMNGPPSPRTVNIQKSQNVPLKLEGLNSNIGFVKKNNAQDNNVLNVQNLDVAGNNNLQQLLQNSKLKEILTNTKNKKRYMVIHPNGEIEHLDSIEHITAQHPNHLFFNSAAIDQMTDTLRPSSLTSSNLPPSPVRPLNLNTPLSPELSPKYSRQLDISNILSHKPQPQDVPFKSNAPTSSVLLSSTRLPQLTQSNISRPPAIPLEDNSKSSPVVLPPVYPPQPELSSTSLPPNIPLKSSTVVQPTRIPSYSKNSLSSASPVVENAPVSLPLVTSTIPILKKSASESIAKTSPDFTNPHASSIQKPANDLHLPQQLHLSAPLVSSDTEKAGSSPVSSPKWSKIDSTHPISRFPIEATPNPVLSPSKNIPMISSPQTPPVLVQNNKYIDDSKNSKTPDSTVLYGESLSHVEPKIISSASKIDVPEKSLPLTITEVDPTQSSDHLSVITLSASENKSNQAIGSKDIHTNYLTLEDKENENTPLIDLVPKPVAMVSPTPDTISTPIDLADLFPITKEDDENMVELADSEVIYNKTTESTESLTTKSDSDTIDHTQSDTTATTTDDGKQTVTDAVVNVSTSDIAHEEQPDENRKELETINSNNSSTNISSHTTKIKSDTEERTDSETEDAQSESQAVYENDKATSNLPSSLKEPSNIDAESLESEIPPIVVDTASESFSSTGADENSPQLSSIVAVDESDDGKENLITKKNMFLSTPPSYDEFWNKLLGDGAVTMVYFVQIPSQNKYVDKEVQGEA